MYQPEEEIDSGKGLIPSYQFRKVLIAYRFEYSHTKNDREYHIDPFSGRDIDFPSNEAWVSKSKLETVVGKIRNIEMYA